MTSDTAVSTSVIFKVAPIKKKHENFVLVGKKKYSDPAKMESLINSVASLHRSVGWPDGSDSLSEHRIRQPLNRAVFAVSPDGKILGYGVARRDSDKRYYISFMAVEKETQRKGMGCAILLRLFEKIVKKGGETVELEFEDTEVLRHFYQNKSIPYSIMLKEKIGKICCNKEGIYHDKNKITYSLTKARE